MRFFPVYLFCLLRFTLPAQVTLVLSAPNDSFDLSCAKCETVVRNVSLTKEQRLNPNDLNVPVNSNLLMWRYYDDILKKNALMSVEPYWTKGVQLIDEAPETLMLSLHINLSWVDSNYVDHQFHLVLAGFNKSNLMRLPLTGVFDIDPNAPLRFYAIGQISVNEKTWETYECRDGIFTLTNFNMKTGAVAGIFSFYANRLGMDKHGVFMNGVFKK
jgi:hypothetical protein